MLSLKVHWHEKVPGTQESRLVRTTPYLRLAHKDGPPIYVQGGVAYGEGGPALDALPDWFAGEMAKVSPKARAEVGWVETRAEAVPATAATASSSDARVEITKAWHCPECNESIPTKRKGLHVARHRKAAKGA